VMRNLITKPANSDVTLGDIYFNVLDFGHPHCEHWIGWPDCVVCCLLVLSVVQCSIYALYRRCCQHPQTPFITLVMHIGVSLDDTPCAPPFCSGVLAAYGALSPALAGWTVKVFAALSSNIECSSSFSCPPPLMHSVLRLVLFSC